MQFSEVLTNLMREHNVTAYRIGQDTGISNRLITYWRKGEKMPGADNLKKIADYFSVTTDYLLGGKEKAPTPVSESEPSDPDKTLLLEKFMELSPENRTKLIELARLFAEDQRRRKLDS